MLELITGDEDKDGLPDEWEMKWWGNTDYGANDDPDGDGKTNYQEWEADTDPTKKPDTTDPNDTDADNLPDAWEMEWLKSLQYGPNDDPDEDGKTNIEEQLAGTDPMKKPTTKKDGDDKAADNSMMIAGAAIAVVVIVIVLLLLMMMMKKKKGGGKEEKPEEPKGPVSPPPGTLKPATTPSPKPVPGPGGPGTGPGPKQPGTGQQGLQL